MTQESFLRAGEENRVDSADDTTRTDAGSQPDAGLPKAQSTAEPLADALTPAPISAAEPVNQQPPSPAAASPAAAQTVTNAQAGTMLDALASALDDAAANVLRSRAIREGWAENDPRAVRAMMELQRKSGRTVLDEIEEALGTGRGREVREAAERLGLDPNDPRLVGYALNQDLEATLERIPDETAAAAASFGKLLESGAGKLDKAFDDGIARVETAAAAYGAKELTTFDVAFAKVASDRIERLVKSTVKAVESPFNKWAMATIIVCGLALAWFAGWWVGHAQTTEALRKYEARYTPMTADVRRYADGFWK